MAVGIAAAVAILLVAAAGYGIYGLFSRSRPAPFQNFSVSKVTETGKATLVAISPDGKYILNVIDDNGQESLWLRNVPTNSNTQVLAPAEVRYIGTSFSPDGNYLYFVRSEIGSRSLKYLYRAPVLGGTPQKLVTDIDSNLSISPDGKKFAYVVQNNPKIGDYRVVIRSVEGGDERDLHIGPMNEQLSDVAWSPDGKTIVSSALEAGEKLSGLYAIDVASGKLTLFATSNEKSLSHPAWLPDGRGLLVLGDTYGAQRQIFFVSFPDGKVSPVTRDTNSYSDLSLAADGHTLATVQSQIRVDPYVMAAGADGSQAHQFSVGSMIGDISWTRDGQLLTSGPISGLTFLNPASGAQTPFLSQVIGANLARTCSDGQIVFTAASAQGKHGLHIFVAEADGGNLKQLTDGKLDYGAVCSADAKTVFYIDADNRLEKVSIEGGPSQQVADMPVFSRINISPGGNLAVFVSAGVRDLKEHLALLPLDSSQAPRLVDFEKPRAEFYISADLAPVIFSPDGKGVIYPIRNGDTDNLWLQHLDGTPGKQLTDFKSELIRDFDYSMDGKQLAVIRGHRESDVVLMRESAK